MSYNSTHTGAQIDAAIDAVENKQDKLVSGTNIKTINNNSLLGSGNINIQGGGGDPSAITDARIEEICDLGDDSSTL